MSQQAIIEHLKSIYLLNNQPLPLFLNAPGMCNALVHLFHRYCIKIMNEMQSTFTEKSARQAIQKIRKKSVQLLHADEPEKVATKIYQLSFFQRPRNKQPEESFCKSSAIALDDIRGINTVYNQQKPSKCNSVFYDNVNLIADFAGCINEKELRKVLMHYLPKHENQLIRIASPTHVIALGYHKNAKSHCSSIFNPNHSFKEIQLIKMTDIGHCKKLIATLENIFYKRFAIDNLAPINLCLSIKFFSITEQQPVPNEKTGAAFLSELMQARQNNELLTDPDGYDSLFISAQYGHSEIVRFLMADYPAQCDPHRAQGSVNKSTPYIMSQYNKHEEIRYTLGLKNTLTHPH